MNTNSSKTTSSWVRGHLMGFTALFCVFLVMMLASDAEAFSDATDDRSNKVNDAAALMLSGSGVLISPSAILTAGHVLGSYTETLPNGRSVIWRNALLAQETVWVPFAKKLTPKPDPCCTVGVRSTEIGRTDPDSYEITENADIKSNDFRSFNTFEPPGDLTATNSSDTLKRCLQACAGHPYCTAFAVLKQQTNQDQNNCFLKSVYYRVQFGNKRDSPRYTAWADAYSMPGPDDIAAIRLTTRVPSAIALPAPVLIRHPDHSTRSPKMREFLKTRWYGAAGWGGGRPVRQKVDAAYEEFPANDGMTIEFNMLRLKLQGNPAPLAEGGDSGSPAFIENVQIDRTELFAPYFARLKRAKKIIPRIGPHLLAGVLQRSGNLPLYVATFGNGKLPFGAFRGKPDVSQWLDQLLFDSYSGFDSLYVRPPPL